MSTLNRIIKVLYKDGTICDYTVTFEDAGCASIYLKLGDGSEKVFSDSDLFKSLRQIRAYFEADKATLLCNGARKDVYPSGMSRGMGRGRKAYILTLGKQARRENLVDIFDYAEPSKVATVEEQEAYYKQWVSSLG